FELYQLAGWNVYLVEILIATLILSIFGYLNIKGSKLSGSIQFYFCVVMLLGVFLLTILVGVSPSSTIENIKPAFAPNKSVFAAMLFVYQIFYLLSFCICHFFYFSFKIICQLLL